MEMWKCCLLFKVNDQGYIKENDVDYRHLVILFYTSNTTPSNAMQRKEKLEA